MVDALYQHNTTKLPQYRQANSGDDVQQRYYLFILFLTRDQIISINFVNLVKLPGQRPPAVLAARSPLY